MPRGDKSSYTGKQKRQAQHIEEGYEKRGIPDKEAERRAWATVNKETGGGKKSGSGRGKPVSYASSRKGGRLGGRAAASRPTADRSRSAKKAAPTRKRRSGQHLGLQKSQRPPGDLRRPCRHAARRSARLFSPRHWCRGRRARSRSCFRRRFPC